MRAGAGLRAAGDSDIAIAVATGACKSLAIQNMISCKNRQQHQRGTLRCKARICQHVSARRSVYRHPMVMNSTGMVVPNKRPLMMAEHYSCATVKCAALS